MNAQTLKAIYETAKKAATSLKVGDAFLAAFQAADKYGYSENNENRDMFIRCYLNELPDVIYVNDETGLITDLA